MSYCRWSSDFFECDVYVYEDVSGGWTTHVAGRRLKIKVPNNIKNMPDKTPEEWIVQHRAVMEWLDNTPENYIDLNKISEHAGESFNDPTPGECAHRLEEIRKSGLNVPQYAIDALRAEALEEEKT